MSDSSRRVNSSLLKRYQNQTIRLPCKPVKARCSLFCFNGSTASVAASDGGQVTITLLPDTHMQPDSYYEVLGSVVNATTVKMLQCMSLGTTIDMNLVDDAIKLMHDERWFPLFSDA
ncbi:replication factor A protein 3 [Mycena amicta]|nr:replication factor A protein 3 [Mycena amicta]